MNFLLGEVYSDERVHHNWLRWEAKWRYDDKYENFIKIVHEPRDDLIDSKTVFLTFNDWDIVYDHYASLSNGFGNIESCMFYYRFLTSFDSRVAQWINADDPNKLIIKSDIFFERKLDRGFYNKVINLFEFNDHYDNACLIHERWYDSRVRACKEFYEFYSSPYWNSFMNKMKLRGNISRNKGLLP
jgi:hypothetical protein